MKYFIILISIFGSLTLYGQDSVNSDAPQVISQADSGNPTEVSGDRRNQVQKFDSTLINTFEYQKAHPEVLYTNKADNFYLRLIVAFAIIGGLGIYLARKSGIVRDMSYDPLTGKLRPSEERPYSFAKMQLLWWTLIVTSCYLCFYLYTGVLVALTPTTVALLGISLGVTVIGNVMTSSQRQENKSEVPILHQDIESNKNWLIDILSDEGGVSIHRFQSLIFNVIYGIGFVFEFVENTTNMWFPFFEFETWQLTLLGISVTGYLGLKANENPKATEKQRQVEAVVNSTPDLSSDTPLDSLNIQETRSKQAPVFATRAFKELKERLIRNGDIPPV